jgi:hypothetical protein
MKGLKMRYNWIVKNQRKIDAVDFDLLDDELRADYEKLQNKVDEKCDELLNLLGHEGFEGPYEVIEYFGFETGYEWMLGNGEWC